MYAHHIATFLTAIMLSSTMTDGADGQVSSSGGEWKPAESPLVTRFAAEVSPERVWQEYPRPQMVRERWENLNGLWEYAIALKEAERPQAFDGQILVPFCVESSMSGVKRAVTPDDALWYRRTFARPKLDQGERLLLHFGAVDWHSQVWVNNQKVAEHRGGYAPFSVDVTDALAADGDQELVLRVWDPSDTMSQPRGKQMLEPQGIWYTAVTGIWQTVWLEPVPGASIAGLSITPNVDRSTVRISAKLAGNAPGAQLAVVVRDGETTVAEAEGDAAAAIDIRIEQPKLWSPDEPHLYDVTVTLAGADGGLDRVDSYFGMRKISLGKDANGHVRLLLNNQPLFQFGPLDQGWWPEGLYTPPTDEALASDVEFTKRAGFNMLRKHVKVEPARFYYHCDRLGMLVWQDMPSGMIHFRGAQHVRREQATDIDLPAADAAQFKTELAEMIDSLKHFPSIVVWVPFNEGWGQHQTNEVLRWTAEYDPTRLVNGPSGWEDRGYGDMKDMHVYPGPGMFPTMDDRASVLGEFGGLGWPVEGHLWQTSKNWGYRTYFSQDELRREYRKLIENLRPLVDRGLAAAVYTQTTDVEIEVNGLLTYDRAMEKLDASELAELHRPLYAAPKGGK